MIQILKGCKRLKKLMDLLDIRRVPHHENNLDKQIAATTLIYDLTVVKRNTNDFNNCGVKLLNPFESLIN